MVDSKGISSLSHSLYGLISWKSATIVLSIVCFVQLWFLVAKFTISPCLIQGTYTYAPDASTNIHHYTGDNSQSDKSNALTPIFNNLSNINPSTNYINTSPAQPKVTKIIPIDTQRLTKSSQTDVLIDITNSQNASISINVDTNANAIGKTKAIKRISIIWFYHIPKTAGTAYEQLMEKRWRKLYNPDYPKNKNKNKNSIQGQQWKKSFQRFFLMNKKRFNITNMKKMFDFYETETIPMIINNIKNCSRAVFIEQHHVTPGMAIFISQLDYLRNILIPNEIKKYNSNPNNEYQCESQFVLCTLLREPVSRLQSVLGFMGIPHKNANKYATKVSNYFIRYILYNYFTTWPWYMDYANIDINISNDIADENGSGMRALYKAMDILENKFDVVGFTNKYDAFVSKVDQLTQLEQNEVYNSIQPFVSLRTKKKFNFTKEEYNWAVKVNQLDSKFYNLTIKRFWDST